MTSRGKSGLTVVCIVAAMALYGNMSPLSVSVLAAEGAPPALKNKVYAAFNAFCIKHYGAEKEPLIYEHYGRDLKLLAEGSWRHVSELSACIGFETNLPARAWVEYGKTADYGSRTPEHERHFYLHLHYLKNLAAGTTYHYRLVSIDERGKEVRSEDATFTTAKIKEAILSLIHI